MTPRRRSLAATDAPPPADPFPHLDGPVHAEFLAEVDCHECRIVTLAVEGQRVTITDGCDVTFTGTLADLCALLRNAEQYNRLDEVQREIDEAWRIARECHADAAQTAERLERIFGMVPVRRALRLMPGDAPEPPIDPTARRVVPRTPERPL